MKCDNCNFAEDGVTADSDNCMECIRRAEIIQILVLVVLLPLSFIAGYLFKTLEKFID